jgi:hypothetical protein
MERRRRTFLDFFGVQVWMHCGRFVLQQSRAELVGVVFYALMRRRRWWYQLSDVSVSLGRLPNRDARARQDFQSPTARCARCRPSHFRRGFSRRTANAHATQSKRTG